MVAEATQRGILGATADGVIAEPGKGAVGRLGTTVVRAGSLDWFRAENIAASPDGILSIIETEVQAAPRRASRTVVPLRDGEGA